MSSKSEEKVKKILEELALEVVKNDSIPDLAEYLDLERQTLYNWINNGKIVIKSVRKKIPNVNVKFLRTGEGPIFDAPLASTP